MKIRNIEIKNFRGIHDLSWAPKPHVNCLIGPGDSGKTTVIDAIELALGLRQQATFDDSDFYNANPDNDIAITVTLGELPPSFKDRYWRVVRGWNAEKEKIIDEPDEANGLETVLSSRLSVDKTLEPKWRIYAERPDDETKEDHRFTYEDRQLMAPTRLGNYTDRHLGWGRQSILARLSGKERIGTEALAKAARAARSSFGSGSEDLFKDAIEEVGKLAREVGVKFNAALSPKIDFQGVSLNSAGISLHQGDLPLRLLGAGSARLLVAALQDHAGDTAPFALIDEVEHGLEPHRISRLLRYLKSPLHHSPPQLFLTTHSPVVLVELSVDDVAVVRRDPSSGKVDVLSARTDAPGSVAQAQLRSAPSAFLARSILVCEGKTEAGLVRGLDQHWVKEDKTPLATAGVAPTNGDGKDKAPIAAKHFSKLGYRVALFLDSDHDPDDTSILPALEALGTAVIRWETGKATEDVLFGDLGRDGIEELIKLLEEWDTEGTGTFLLQINSEANQGLVKNFEELKGRCAEPEMRKVLASSAKRNQWFKRIDRAEEVGARVLGPQLTELRKDNAACIEQLRNWIDGD